MVGHVMEEKCRVDAKVILQILGNRRVYIGIGVLIKNVIMIYAKIVFISI